MIQLKVILLCIIGAFSASGFSQDTLKFDCTGIDTLETWQGVKYCKVHTVENGITPKKGDKIYVRYAGYLENGQLFDTSGKGTFVFSLQKLEVIRGWDIVVSYMKEGEKVRAFIPWKLAYGKFGNPPVIPRKANLIFDIELIKVVK